MHKRARLERRTQVVDRPGDQPEALKDGDCNRSISGRLTLEAAQASWGQ